MDKYKTFDSFFLTYKPTNIIPYYLELLNGSTYLEGLLWIIIEREELQSPEIFEATETYFKKYELPKFTVMFMNGLKDVNGFKDWLESKYGKIE